MEMKSRLEGLLTEVEEVYVELEGQSDKLFDASELAIKSKQKLEIGRLTGMANGSIFGKNADEREACAREVIGELFTSYGEAQDTERIAKHDFDQAFLKVELSRARLRILELLVKVEVGNGQ